MQNHVKQLEEAGIGLRQASPKDSNLLPNARWVAESEELIIGFASSRDIESWIEFIVSREEAHVAAKIFFEEVYMRARKPTREKIDQWLIKGAHSPYTRKLERRISIIADKREPPKSGHTETVRILESVATGKNLGILSDAIEDAWQRLRQRRDE